MIRALFVVLLAVALAVVAVLDPGTAVTPSTSSAPADTATDPTEQATEQSTEQSTVVPGLVTSRIDVSGISGREGTVRIGVLEPEGEPVADLIFLHGHADRLDNHRELFLAFAASGVRVISYDLPSHGLTDAGPLDVWSFADLAALTGLVEKTTRDSGERPLVLSGWSFGGLLATRIAQTPEYSAALSRPLAALAVENPALVPLPFSGGDGVSKLRALTHDLSAPVAGPPTPASPFLNPVFAGRLLSQAAIGRSTPLPNGLDTLVVLSDPAEDLYVDPTEIRTWAEEIAPQDGAAVTVVQCAGSRHGADIEAWPIGAAARDAMVDFVADAVGSRPAPAQAPEVSTACE
jgi:pimeloyl-ACP methyl ester carboxylesterase